MTYEKNARKITWSNKFEILLEQMIFPSLEYSKIKVNLSFLNNVLSLNFNLYHLCSIIKKIHINKHILSFYSLKICERNFKTVQKLGNKLSWSQSFVSSFNPKKEWKIIILIERWQLQC